ncbi:MAG TPA: hypothetical protein VFJ06_04060 [Halococcus sp.]|nr:hypothetical protein [Halococcus sp.]
MQFFDREHTHMPTAIEFVAPSGGAIAEGPIGPRLEPTPVDAQQTVTTTDEQFAPFDGREIRI